MMRRSDANHAHKRLSPGHRRRKIVFAAVLVALLVTLYDPTRLENTSGDTISARYWPVAILRHGTYTLNPFRQDLQGVDYAALYDSNGDWLPRATWGMLPLTVPFYWAVDALGLGGRDWSHDRVSRVSRWNAMFLAIGAALGLFLLFCRFAPPGVSLASSLLFALGTWNWSLGAQGLSSQTALVFALAIHLHLLWRACEGQNGRPRDAPPGVALGLGLCGALVFAIRPADILLVLPAAAALRFGRPLAFYLLGLLPPAAAALAANKAVFHHPLGFYGVLAGLIKDGGAPLWTLNLHQGIPGLLLSPNRGAIVFFPSLLLLPYLWRKLMPPLRVGRLARALVRLRLPVWGSDAESGVPEGFAHACAWGMILYFVSIASLDYWHGTWSYGPRYLYNLQPLAWPFLTVALAEAARTLEGERSKIPAWSAAALALFQVQGVAVHALGHFNYDLWVWNARKPGDFSSRAWDFGDFMLAEVWEAGPNAERFADALVRLKERGF